MGCNAKDIQTIVEGPEVLRIPMKCWPDSPLAKLTPENDELIRFVNTITPEQQPIDGDKFNDWNNCCV